MSVLIDNNATLLQHIKELLDNGVRGTLFITTANNRSVTLAFENGVVTGISSRGLVRGVRALEHLVQIEQASYKFDDNMLTLPGGMPDPDDVTRILGIRATRRHVSANTYVNDDVEPSTNSYHERALQIFDRHLKEALGPYAIIVIQELRASLLDELDTIEKASELAYKLAEEIDSQNQAQEFVKLVLSDLSTLYKSII